MAKYLMLYALFVITISKKHPHARFHPISRDRPSPKKRREAHLNILHQVNYLPETCAHSDGVSPTSSVLSSPKYHKEVLCCLGNILMHIMLIWKTALS